MAKIRVYHKFLYEETSTPLQLAASVSFLIARYLARDRILKLVEGNQKFQAIDRAIGDNGFRVVALLRLSPLLPFALGNYLYGLTSVEFLPYIVGRLVELFFCHFCHTFLLKRFLRSAMTEKMKSDYV